MQQVVRISVVLLNVVWISFFLTPDLDFSVFVQRRSTSSSDEAFKFCLQPDSDRKWTSAGPSASGPDDDISTVTEQRVNWEKTTEAAPVAKTITVAINREIDINKPIQQEVNSHPFIREGNSDGPDHCCYNFIRIRINKSLIYSYHRIDSRCPTSGVILITTT